MALKTMKPSEIEPFLKLLIYGPVGTGKSTWTAQNAPRPCAYIDFERSSDVIKSMGIDDIDIVPVTPKDTMDDVLKFVRDLVKNGYASVVFDTISSSQIFQLGDHMKGNNRDLPLFQDYRKSTATFNDVFFALQHMPIHVILIGHEKDYYEGEGEFKKLVQTGPAMTPAIKDAVTQLSSGVFRFTRSGASIKVQVLERGKLIGKNRYGFTEQEISNPTWDTFMRKLMNNAT